MERLKELVKGELGFLPEGDGMDRLFERGEWLHLPAKHVIIEAGRRCSDVFLVRDGIIRFADLDGDKERTFAFALPGTMIHSQPLQYNIIKNLLHRFSYYRQRR